MDLFRKIISDAATIPQIGEVCLTGLGESLLDPDLEERIRYVKGALPHAFTNVYTNGTHLTPVRFEALQAAGLDMILVSLNAANAETRLRVMGLDDWEKVVSNVTYAVGHEDTCKVSIRAVVNKDSFKNEDTEILYRLWGAQGDGGRFQSVREGNWAGDSRTVREFKPNESCARALGQIYVTFDGKVTTCCFDPLGRQTFGDLSTESIRDVYNSERYVKFREAHSEDRADEYELCRECSRI